MNHVGDKAWFGGEWTEERYPGVIDGFWSGGVQWRGDRATAIRVAEDMNAISKGDPKGDHLAVTECSLVMWSGVDSQFYIEDFDSTGYVRMPSWTWVVEEGPREVDIFEIVAYLKSEAALIANDETGFPGPTDIRVSAPSGDLVFCRDFNREDGGWEAQLHWQDEHGGDISGIEIPDGPGRGASVSEIAVWIVRCYQNFALVKRGIC